MKICAIDDCKGEVFSREWCVKHYTRWLRHGDPLKVTRTPPMTADATDKNCPRCHTIKPIGEFGRRSGGAPKGYCMACEATYQSSHAATPEGREMRRLARSKWNDGNHGYFLMYRYGITIDDYERMLDEQGGRCAICATDVPGSRNKVWSVDHCHTINKVRGLLCAHCNWGLGHFKDDPDRLRAAASYLQNAWPPAP